MRAFLLFLLGLLIGACAGPTHVIVQVPDSVSQAGTLESKTVALVMPSADGVRAYCSGVWISPALVLTAQHCVDDLEIGDKLLYAVRGDVFGSGLKASEFFVPRIAALVASDFGHDLAVFRAAEPPVHAVAALSLGPIQQGMAVQTMGHPKGLWWSYSRGDVAAIRHEELGLDILWIQSTAPISPGNSGGGLFDVEGNIIGVCSRAVSLPRVQNLNFYVHRDHIAAFLRGLR